MAEDQLTEVYTKAYEWRTAMNERYTEVNGNEKPLKWMLCLHKSDAIQSKEHRKVISSKLNKVMKVNPKFDTIQFVSSRKNYNVKESIEKLLGCIVKGDIADGELGSDVSYMHLRRTTVKMTAGSDETKRETDLAEMPTIIEKGKEELVESPAPLKKSVKRFSSSKKKGLLDGSVTDIPNEVSIFPATEIDGQLRTESKN